MEHSSAAFSQHVIYTLVEGAGQSVGAQGGMEQLTENDCHEWKPNVQQSIPKKETPREQVCDLLFMQLASYLQVNVNQMCFGSFFKYQEYFVNSWLIYL